MAMPSMKDCMQTHTLLHNAAGLGLGFLLVGLIPTLGAGTAVVLGIIFLVIGFGGEFFRK